jgi:hypothetical protein
MRITTWSVKLSLIVRKPVMPLWLIWTQIPT